MFVHFLFQGNILMGFGLQEPSASSWLSELACRSTHEQFTNSIVVSVATPDFSMPYIVCALTSSLLAVFAGMVITTLVERRRMQAFWVLSKSGKRKRQIGVAIVLVTFLALVPYLDTEWRDWLRARAGEVGFKV
jgi:hypothetical protein